GFRVAGALPDVRGGAQRKFQYSQIGKRQELSLWIRHLLLCAAYPGAAFESSLCARKNARRAAMVRFAPVAEPTAPLAQLARLYVDGMTAPLPLFEGASRRYAEDLRD